ncbi:hypothetical protein GCM10009682_23300 [Luedemannella flava]|uniref:Flagellar motor switch protein FliN-like C-terminal domain-containing protein n=1 Tax=Luedemannella flava TaxID=349316 RepID=A0ABP4Y2V5_9ACTN
MTVLPDTSRRLDLARAAAAAAVAVLPSSQPLEVGVPTSTLPEHLPAGQAVTARFTGTATGDIVVLVAEDLATALQQSPFGPLDLASAVRSAIESAAGVFGPVVVEPGQQMEPSVAFSAIAAKGDAMFVPLLEGDQTRAAIGISVRAGGGETARVAERVADAAPSLRRAGLDLLHDVEMEISAELGRTRMSVRELLSLAPGAVVELDRAAGSPADLLVNGRLIARGEVVVIDENFGIRITDIVSPVGERG